MKHTIKIEPSTHLRWNLTYDPNCGENCFRAEHPEKPRTAIYAPSFDALIRAIEKREDGLCRLKTPIPVAVRSYNVPKRTEAEIFAYDEAVFYCRRPNGEIFSEFLSNLQNGNSISVRLRDEKYPALLAEAIKADAAAAKAAERQRKAKDAFVEITPAAIKSAPFTKDQTIIAEEEGPNS